MHVCIHTHRVSVPKESRILPCYGTDLSPVADTPVLHPYPHKSYHSSITTLLTAGTRISLSNGFLWFPETYSTFLGPSKLCLLWRRAWHIHAVLAPVLVAGGAKISETLSLTWRYSRGKCVTKVWWICSVCKQLLEQQIETLSWSLGEVFTRELLLDLGLKGGVGIC